MFRVGDHVRMGSRSGVVVACQPQGMFDIKFEGVDHVERRSGDKLMRRNGRDIVDPSLEQFRATVSGIYDSLVKKYRPRSAKQKAALRQRAFAIGVGVGRKHGYLEQTGIKATPKGAVLAAARLGGHKPSLREMVGMDEHMVELIGTKTAKSAAERRRRYESMLAEGRKSGRVRITTEVRRGKAVPMMQPSGKLIRMIANPEDDQRITPRGLHREALAEARGKRQGGSPLSDELRMYHPAKRGAARLPPSVEQLESNFTPTMLFAVPPASDPDLKGYFIVSYDPRNRRVISALDTVRGWTIAPNVTHVAFEKSDIAIEAGRGEQVVRKAPKAHTVISFGRGRYIVVGPKARKDKDGTPKDMFTTREAAEAHATDLDMKAARFGIAQTHDVGLNDDGTYYITGPKADPDRSFTDAEQAQRVARALDRVEASSGAVPLAGKRTKVGASAKEAVRLLDDLLAVFDQRGIFLKRGISRGQVNTILRGPPKDAPAPEFLHLNLAQIKAQLMKRGVSEDEADVFVADEKLRRQKFMPTRLELEKERTRIARERRGPVAKPAEFEKGRRQAQLRDVERELAEVRRKLGGK